MFEKVTGRTTINCILCDPICEENNSKIVSITYIDPKDYESHKFSGVLRGDNGYYRYD